MSVGEASYCLPRVTTQWSVRRARRLQSQVGSVDLTKDAIMLSECSCRSVYVCRGVSFGALLYTYNEQILHLYPEREASKKITQIAV